MYGALIGSVLGGLFCYGMDISYWWVFAGAGLGGLLELAIRVGSGEEFGDALGNLVTAGFDLSGSWSSSGDSSSSDYSGGGDYSSDSGGSSSSSD